MEGIMKSVGRGGINRKEDVIQTQKWLNLAVYGLNLVEDGGIGPATIAGIDYFQSNSLGLKPSGKISPDDTTMIVLRDRALNPQCTTSPIGLPATGNATKLSSTDFGPVAKELGCEEAAIRAVTEVESRGAGFLESNRPKILFEAHIFSRLTFHCFDKTYPDISSKNWNKKLYLGGEQEYDRLTKAMAVNRPAALQSASWGMFQIMGFNYQKCSLDSVEIFITAMFESEAKHLKAFANFIKSAGISAYLKNKNWAAFASAYNGSSYAENAYDTKIEEAYKRFSGAKL